MSNAELVNATEVENYRLTAALQYARMGWRVFPTHVPKLLPDGSVTCTCSKRAGCGNIGKHPATANGLKDATTDETVIRKWWADMPWANVAIETGAASNLLVIDCDASKGGIESWNELVASYGDPPATPLCETGGGGLHFFFAYPGGPARDPNPWRNSAEVLGKGIDTRGDGGYVVAAPSYHRSDNHYAWRLTPEFAPPAPLPPWLAAMLVARDADKPRANGPVVHRPALDDAQQFWLGKALAKVTDGNRNDTGFWLAVQLRDAGVSADGARATLATYVDRCPQNGAAYTHGEAMASVEQAFARPRRERAIGKHRSNGNQRIWTPSNQIVTPSNGIWSPEDDTPFGVTPASATAELSEFYEGIIDGSIYDATWPWPMLSEYTQSLIPGTTTLIVGDPGVGKTYLFIQALLYWQQHGIDAAVYFIEKRRRFYTKRMLAFLEGSFDFLNFTWVHQHPKEVREALERHRDVIDACGKRIYSSNGQQVTLVDLLNWIRQMFSSGKRVVCIDPISAVAADVERWTKDDEFVLQAEALADAHDGSLAYVTHSKKGNRPGMPTGHDAAHGAAYFRFADTLMWLLTQRPKKPRDVRFRDLNGLQGVQRPDVFFQIHKAREGPGTGQELAYKIGSGGRFTEQGVVIEDVDPTAS